MRFAIIATDRYIGVFEALLGAGWEPLRLVTEPVDERLHHNRAVIDLGRKVGVEVQISPVQEEDLRTFGRRGCDVLVVASHSRRIGDWRPYLPYAVNFHPSPLPEGRGPYPQVRAILEQRREWAVSCHKLEPEFDSGDILDQERFALAPDECHESLDLKIQMATGRLAQRVGEEFPRLWEAARPQGEGSYWPFWRPEERAIDFDTDVEAILRQVRAFGLMECTAVVNSVNLYVRRAVGWTESHVHPPGTLVYANSLNMVVAARDGYIGIVEWSLLEPGANSGRIGR